MRGRALAEAFISCAPGLETELAAEVREARALCLNEAARFLQPEWEITQSVRGGLSLQASLIAIYQLNHWLKTAHRILLRIEEFSASSLPRLRERLKSLRLQDYGAPWDLKIEARRCRINDERLVRRLCEEVLPVAAPNKTTDFHLYIRGNEDRWTVSVDTTGDHLHRRGWRKTSGGAPIRETLAAFSLRLMTAGEPVSRLQEIHLLDPMAGSGTFLREGEDLFRPLRAREFAFQKFRKIPPLLKAPAFWKNFDMLPMGRASLFKRLWALERDENAIGLLKNHLSPERAMVIQTLFKDKRREDLGLSQREPLWVVTNPPYGHRLADTAWMNEIWPWLSSLQPEKFLIWMPKDLVPSFLKEAQRHSSSLPDHLAGKPEEWKVSNGGLDCRVLGFFDRRR